MRNSGKLSVSTVSLCSKKCPARLVTQQLKSSSSNKGLDQIQGNMIVTIAIEVEEAGATTSQEGDDRGLTLETSSFSAMSLTSLTGTDVCFTNIHSQTHLKQRN